MKLRDDIDYTGLGWVKHELDETLKESRQALEAYVEGEKDEGLMRTCSTRLHQAQGTLRMVELYGAALVVEEMERLAEALLAGSIKQRDEAYSVLMRGMVQLPDYLERVQSGYKDIPIVLLPLLNDLRACRGQKLLSESALFAPDLDAPLPEVADGCAAPVPIAQLRNQAIRLRLAFQAALLKWFRDEQENEYPDRLLAVLDRLRGLSCAQGARRLWWVAAGVIEAVRDRALESSVAVKLLFGRVDREIRHFAESGEDDLGTTASRELVQNLLYYVAHSTSTGPRVSAIRACFKLDSLLPTEDELEHAQGSMTGHNRVLLDTVSAAIKDDLLRVKEALDIFLRAHADNPADLLPQVDVLDRVGDTLGMLGLGVPRRVVEEQRAIVEAIANAQRPADEGSLLDVAGALLYIEVSLDDHIEQLGAGSHDSSADGDKHLPRAEVRKILDTLMHEAAVNIQQAKHDIIAFIEAPWDHARVEPIPRLLEEIAGALRMLAFDRAAQLMTGIVRFVEVELLSRRRVPSAEQMDTLADALASIEYYLEATREQRGGREKILEVTRRSLELLGYWPLPDTDLAESAESTSTEPAADAQSDNVPAPQPPKPEVPTDDELLLAGEEVPLGAREIQRLQGDRGGAPELTGVDLPDPDAPTADEGASAAMDANDEPEIPQLDTDVEILPGRDLGDLVVGETRATEPPAHDITGLRFAETAQTEDAGEWIEIEKEVEEPAPSDEVAAGFQSIASEDIDDDIRAVFVEEVEDEIPRMRHQFNEWQNDPEDLAKLTPLRRSFHTLKGSGRLVGAVVLGEFSWKIENLLNRVLDMSVPMRPAVRALVEHALNAVPELLKGLRGAKPQVNVAAIVATADRLAAGEEAWVPESASATRAQRRDVRRPVAAASDQPASTDKSIADGELPALDVPAAFQAGIDPVLFDILRTEVAAHVATLGEYVDSCKSGARVPTEPVQRAVHTLSGAIAMVDIAALSAVLTPFEGYVTRLRATARSPSAEGVALMDRSLTLVRDVMTRLEDDVHELPDSGDLASQMRALRDSQPEETSLFEQSVDDGSTPTEAPAVAQDLDEMLQGVFPQLPSEVLPSPGALTGIDDVSASAAPDQAFSRALGSALNVASGVADSGRDAVQSAGLEGSQAPADTTEAAEPHEIPEALHAEPDAEGQAATAPEAEATEREAAPEAKATEAEAEASEEAVPEPETVQTSGPRTPEPDAPEVPVAPETSEVEDHLDIPDLDEDLLEIFVQEGVDILDHSDSLMAGLREAADDTAALAGLQRDLHTLKGGARMAGLAPIGHLAHAMESLLEAIDDKRRDMDPVAIKALERGFDDLHGLIQRVSRRRAIKIPDETIAYFAALIEGRSRVTSEDGAANLVETEARDVEPARATTPPPPARQLPTLGDEDSVHAPQEMIRVRSDLLDSLVNYAGEVSIYRSRLEQQISGFRFNLVEFEQTVHRLREQLRKLEIETEAQIIARFQREHQEGLASFDPLELDRFSQLQQYSRALAESVSDLVSIQGLLDDITRQSETLLLQQSRVSSDLQEGLMRTRMVPFDSLVPSLRRTLRQSAQELGKQAQIKVEGAQGEMDRNLLERMKAPFEHILRNALAHGIESPEQRLAAGKPVEGTINIAVSRDATEVVLRVSDDGRGIDREAIRAKAIERGLLKPGAELSDRDLYGFILESGFSTVDHVTELAGRGVGMDVVHNEIKQLGGSLQIDSVPGQGATFTLRLPFTLAVTQAILVKLGDAVYAIPMSSVLGVVRIEGPELERRLRSDDPTFSYAGDTFTLYELSQLLGVPTGRTLDDTQASLLMTRSGDQRAGVRIDAVVGSREIVVKSVGPQISSVPGVFGATVMGDGSVVIILDLAPLVRRTSALRERVAHGEAIETPELVAPPADQPQRRQPLIMVVDDSITMRKVSTRVLERADMDVFTAKDGLDAVEKLQEKVPDLMLLDIEMPRMDGYELATYMKNDSRLKHVPIIMITSRTGEKHRQRAFEIGVERYLGKPYQEADLVQNVQEILRSSGVDV
ncbi:MAG: Hpt domain-containing protein [Rhodanobacteraceae bacterium]